MLGCHGNSLNTTEHHLQTTTNVFETHIQSSTVQEICDKEDNFPCAGKILKLFEKTHAQHENLILHFLNSCITFLKNYSMSVPM